MVVGVCSYVLVYGCMGAWVHVCTEVGLYGCVVVLFCGGKDTSLMYAVRHEVRNGEVAKMTQGGGRRVYACACMFVCVYMCVHAYVCVCVCACICVRVCIFGCVCMCMCMDGGVFVPGLRRPPCQTTRPHTWCYILSTTVIALGVHERA